MKSPTKYRERKCLCNRAGLLCFGSILSGVSTRDIYDDGYMNDCLLCDQPIQEISAEHVLPKSIGGALVSRDVICKTCNDTYGYEVDSVLSRAFRDIVLAFGINNSAGFQEVTGTDGEIYLYQRSRNRLTPRKPLPPVTKHLLNGTIKITQSIPAWHEKVKKRTLKGIHKLIEKTRSEKSMDGKIKFSTKEAFTQQTIEAPDLYSFR